jgi:cation:H+ antiporter
MSLLCVTGIVILYFGAKLLVDGATSLAKNLGIPIIVIGFTVVAVGTSMPELIVGIIAALMGDGPLVVGNIVGSNMVNFGVVLGLAALMGPVATPRKNHRVETASLVLSVAILYLMIIDGSLSRVDGVFLFLLGILFCWLSIRRSRDATLVEQQFEKAITLRHRRDTAISIMAALSGIALLFAGARMLVVNAVSLAHTVGVSEVLIGLTLVAIGTSLPEIVTTIVSGIRKSPDLSLGNAVGSNIINIFLVLGLTVTIAPVEVTPTLWRYDLPILMIASVLIAAFLRHGRQFSRVSGALMMVGYFVYIIGAFYLRGGQVF